MGLFKDFFKDWIFHEIHHSWDDDHDEEISEMRAEIESLKRQVRELSER